MVVLLFLSFIAPFLIALLVPLVMKFTTSPAANALSHGDVIALISDFDNPKLDGVCYGFTLNWAVSVAESETSEQNFYQKLQLMNDFQRSLPEKVKQIYQKKHHQPLTERDHQLVTIPELCKKIVIAQQPIHNRKKYGKLVWQADVPDILRTIHPSSVVPLRVYHKTHTFASREELKSYLGLLVTLGINSKTAVVISTDEHAVGFKRAGNLWRFIDINSLFEQSQARPYSEFTAKELANELYWNSLTITGTQRLVVNTDFIATQSGHHLFGKLNNTFPAFPAQTQMQYSDQLLFFAMSALQGDLLRVKQCLQSGWSILENSQLTKNSPLVRALSEGRRDVVKEMLLATSYPINRKRKSDGNTLLHLVCKKGSPGIVEDLLKFKKILIDSKNKRGMTPLMVACNSTIMNEEEKTFRLLLAKGASVTERDNNDNTALDYAIKKRNKPAIKLIKAKSCHGLPTAHNRQPASSRNSFFSRVNRKTSDLILPGASYQIS